MKASSSGLAFRFGPMLPTREGRFALKSGFIRPAISIAQEAAAFLEAECARAGFKARRPARSDRTALLPVRCLEQYSPRNRNTGSAQDQHHRFEYAHDDPPAVGRPWSRKCAPRYRLAHSWGWAK